MHTEAVGDASGETEQIIEESLYPDMPDGLTYIKKLVWKSHRCDELQLELKGLEKKYKQRIAPDAPLELLTTAENLKLYEWIKRLPDNEHSLRIIQYAYLHEQLFDEFMDDLIHKDSPFYLPLAEKWAQGFWEGEKTKLEVEVNAKTKELQDLAKEITIKTAQGDTDLKALIKEREAVLKKLEIEKAKLDGIEKKTKAIDVLTDWFRQFYAKRFGVVPTQEELVNSIFKVEGELHTLGLYGICNKCRDKLQNRNRWPT